MDDECKFNTILRVTSTFPTFVLRVGKLAFYNTLTSHALQVLSFGWWVQKKGLNIHARQTLELAQMVLHEQKHVTPTQFSMKNNLVATSTIFKLLSSGIPLLKIQARFFFRMV